MSVSVKPAIRTGARAAKASSNLPKVEHRLSHEPPVGPRRPAVFLRHADGLHQGQFGRGEMRPARGADGAPIAAQQSIDVIEVLLDRDLVALPFVAFVPLIVVVKDQRDDVVEIVDEAIGHGRVDEPVQPVIEIGEVMEPPVEIGEQVAVLLP